MLSFFKDQVTDILHYQPDKSGQQKPTEKPLQDGLAFSVTSSFEEACDAAQKDNDS